MDAAYPHLNKTRSVLNALDSTLSSFLELNGFMKEKKGERGKLVAFLFWWDLGEYRGIVDFLSFAVLVVGVDYCCDNTCCQ